MPRRLFSFTDLQLQILDAIWDRGEASVAEVHTSIPAGAALARKTVATMLVRLENEGVLTHRQEAREYIYRARVSREAVRSATVANIAERLFRGNVPALFAHVLSSEQVMPGDIERARAMLDAYARDKPRKRK